MNIRSLGRKLRDIRIDDAAPPTRSCARTCTDTALTRPRRRKSPEYANRESAIPSRNARRSTVPMYFTASTVPHHVQITVSDVGYKAPIGVSAARSTDASSPLVTGARTSSQHPFQLLHPCLNLRLEFTELRKISFGARCSTSSCTTSLYRLRLRS